MRPIAALCALALSTAGCLREVYLPPANLNAATGATVRVGSLRPLKPRRFLRLDVWILQGGKCSKGELLGEFHLDRTPSASFLAPAGKTVEIYATWTEHHGVTGYAMTCLTATSFAPEAGRAYDYLFADADEDGLCRSSIAETYRQPDGGWAQRPLAAQASATCPGRTPRSIGPTDKLAPPSARP